MTTKEQQTSEKKSPQFSLQKIYTKDISFESPNPAEIFSRKQFVPDINVQLNTESARLSEDVYEVVLSVTVNAKLKAEDKTAYLVEIKQAGIFTVANFPGEEFGLMINSYIPGILFPYAREIVSGLVERGGYPQLLLAPINFEALYRDHLQKLTQAENPASDVRH